MEKKAMSEVVTTVLMVVLVMALIAFAWAIINGMVHREMKSTEACFGNFDKLEINKAYTCYNTTSGDFYFSLNVRDVTLEKVLIAIGISGTTHSIALNSTSQDLTNLKNYPSNLPGVMAPGINSGKTYSYSGLGGIPDYIRVSPVINGETCQQADSLENIEACSDY